MNGSPNTDMEGIRILSEEEKKKVRKELKTWNEVSIIRRLKEISPIAYELAREWRQRR